MLIFFHYIKKLKIFKLFIKIKGLFWKISFSIFLLQKFALYHHATFFKHLINWTLFLNKEKMHFLKLGIFNICLYLHFHFNFFYYIILTYLKKSSCIINAIKFYKIYISNFKIVLFCVEANCYIFTSSQAAE